MASIFDGIDMSDPCALWPKLQEVHDRLLGGEQVISTRFGNDETRWQATNMPALGRRIQELKAQCAAKSGGRPARFAIRAGFRRY